MNITLPTPEVTTGPEWANQIVDAFDNVDGHDHTAGKGVKVPTAGLNINADLEFNSYNATELNSTRYINQGSTLSGLLDKNCLYFVGGDLFINNNAGTSVQITSGASINLSTVGTIGGDYGQPGVTASATYSNATKTFSWTQAPTQAAKMAVGDLIVYETVASATPITIKSSSGVTVGYDFWLPQSAPTANQLWRQNSTATGANFVTIQGTANQLTITHTASAITASLPSTLITPGTLSVTGNFDVGTNKFTVAAGSGATAIAGDLAIATNKFTVLAASGNTLVAGSLAVNGGSLTSSAASFDLITTPTSVNFATSALSLTIGANNVGTTFIRTIATNFTGNIDVNNKFNVSSATGDISTLGNIAVNTNRFTVDGLTGNTAVAGTLAVTNTATFSGSVNITGNGRGIVPLGAIIPMTSGFTGAMAVPASGVVSNGWIRCDGAAIPGGNTVSGTTPNLTTSIYLRGASTYGGTGGNNTTTLIEANLPAHTHANTLTNATVGSSSHTHSIAHTHQNGWFGTAGGVNINWQYANYTNNSSSTGWSDDFGSGGRSVLVSGGITYGGTGSSATVIIPGFAVQAGATYTSGVLSAPSGSGASAASGAPSATTTVGITNASIGSGTAFSNQPNYIDVIYMMRVN